MKDRCRRIPWLTVLLVAACGGLPGIPKMPEIPKQSPMDAAQRALNRITGGALDAEGKRVMLDVGQAAVDAVASISGAVVHIQGEVRVREVLLEEESHLLIAATQSFYTDECASAGPAPPAGADPANLGDLREASEAFQRAEYGKAASLLERAYEERKKQLGANHPVVLSLLNKQAAIQLAVNNYMNAMPFAMKALASREQSLRGIKPTTPPGHDEIGAALAVGESETMIAHIYRAIDEHAKARQHYERAIELRARYLGADHLCAAQSQSALGELFQLMGDYPAARRALDAGLWIRQAKLGPQHRDTARSIKDLASFYRTIGDLPRAQELYQQALGIRLTLGEDDIDVAESHNDLGDLYKLRGDYVNAESEYQKALDIRRKKLGEGAETAESQNALAGLYEAMGDYGRAQEQFSVAYGIRKRVFGPDHTDTAESLNDLGDSHLALGDYANAELEYGRALDIRRNKLGGDHPLVAKSLVALGNLHVKHHDYTKAESEYSQALDIQRKKFGPDHHEVAQSQHQLGLLYQARGDYKKAESFYRSALSLREKKLGSAHPSVAESLVSLAKLMMATGRHPQALEYAHRAFDISEQLLQRIGGVACDSRMNALLLLLRAQEEVAYSFLLEKSFSADAATFAMSVALLRKGRSLDVATSASRAAYQSPDGTIRDKLADLRATRAQLGALTLAGGDDTTKLQRLADHADELEQALAKASPSLLASLIGRPSEIVTRVAQVLPPDGVLVEIVAFRPCVLHGQGQDAGHDPQRYLALVLHHDASVRVVPLGLGDSIEKLIGDFRTQIAVEGKKVDKQVAKEVDKKVLISAEALYHSVFEPVRAQFVKADKNIFLSLDSQLQLVPFAALFDGNDYLVETYEFTYLTSGRDLLRGDVGLRNNTKVEVIANPDFIKSLSNGPGTGPGARGLYLVPGWTHDADRLLRPLPGTVDEAHDIRQLLPGTQVLSRSNATKDALLGIQSPGILHVATHGYFLASTDHAVAGQRTQVDNDRAALLSSMLMLAGAGVRGNDGTVDIQSRGVATALEVAGMNLWGTQLVVLSACETGVGDVSNLGQGVYGLRRAVMIAGAETLVTSLWKVDDEATQKLMVRYYESLLAGRGRVEAMREAANSMRRSRKHPYYWASFIVVGSRDPLVGIGRKRQPAIVTPVVAGSKQTS